MNILYIYAHPNERSLNHYLYESAQSILHQQGHQVTTSNLYQINFNAAANWGDFVVDARETPQQYMLAQQQALSHNQLSADITAEMHKINNADHLIFQFPLWWFSAPAILKGWMDRIFVKGFAYDAGKVFDKGLLRHKSASILVTTHSPASAYQASGMHGSSIETFLHPIHHTLRFVGITNINSFVIYDAANTDEQRLAQILRNMNQYFAMTLGSD